MQPLIIYNRKTKQKEEEKIFGAKLLFFLYHSSIISSFVRFFVTHFAFVSFLYGKLQKSKKTKKKIWPFIKEYGINPEEFEKSVEDYESFSDFFIRRLKKEKRPIEMDDNIVIIPSDARYTVFQDLSMVDDFYIKGQRFDIKRFLQDDELAKKFERGSMAIARLCPADYHRFHFPLDGFAEKSYLIDGGYFSVNPFALKKVPHLFSQNKRAYALLKTKKFKTVLIAEVGATCVGSIHQTYEPDSFVKKGDEKGFFDFGASTVVLLFESGVIQFEKDLLEYSAKGIEVKANMGQILGRLQS
ncbi:MAG TPA: phosphatidylserine decarboxylase [Chlamydiales bacterium]|nr:phosphatidylserine decarboxylase [Chlamydiales bacterium]